jgi:hypothetical protein
MSVQRPPTRPRARDARGRFVKRPKAPPLTAQTLGDLTALIVPDEATPANCLATQAVFTVHANWWEYHAPAAPT